MGATDTSGSDHANGNGAGLGNLDDALREQLAELGLSFPAREHEPHRPRRLGHLIGMRKTRKGGANNDEEQVRETAAARGALRGHAGATHERDAALTVLHADGAARERAASFARRAVEALADAAKRLLTARATEERASALVEEAGPAIERVDKEIAKVERKVVELEAAAPAPPKPPAPDADEFAAEVAARASVPSSLRQRVLACGIFGGFVESFYSGTFASDAGVFGVDLLPPWANLLIPWIAGASIGILIVLGAAVAGQINGRVRNPGNPAFGQWWRARAAELWLAVVGLFVGLRALYGLIAYDAAAGALGLAVGGVMFGIAVVSAAAGAELDRRSRAQALARAVHAVRERHRLERTPPPSQAERERDAWRRRLEELRAQAARLHDERAKNRSIAHLAQDDAQQAAVDLNAVAARSRLEASQEDGLADVAIAIDVTRARAVEATYHDQPPASATPDPDKLRRSAAGTGALPHARIEDVLPGAAVGDPPPDDEQEDDA